MCYLYINPPTAVQLSELCLHYHYHTKWPPFAITRVFGFRVKHLRGQTFGLLEQHKYNIVIMVSKRHLVKEKARQKHTASGCSGLFGLRQLVSVFSLDVWCEHPQWGLKLFHGDPNILPKVTNWTRCVPCAAPNLDGPRIFFSSFSGKGARHYFIFSK